METTTINTTYETASIVYHDKISETVQNMKQVMDNAQLPEISEIMMSGWLLHLKK